MWRVTNDLWAQCPNSWLTCVPGDFNLRWHYRYGREADVLFPCIVGRGRTYLEGLTHDNNRDFAFEFSHERGLKHVNSRFANWARAKFTFRELATPDVSGRDPTTYGELDHVFCNNHASL